MKVTRRIFSLTAYSNDTDLGDWSENVREGHGTYTYPNNDTYAGEWKNHLRHGKGTYTYAATSTYHSDEHLQRLSTDIPHIFSFNAISFL